MLNTRGNTYPLNVRGWEGRETIKIDFHKTPVRVLFVVNIDAFTIFCLDGAMRKYVCHYNIDGDQNITNK